MSLLGDVAGAVNDLFQVGAAGATQAASDFIAGPEPSHPIARLEQAAARQVCRGWARGLAPNLGRGADTRLAGACNPYLESIGEKPIDGSNDPPFAGGQCPGEQYLVSVFRGSDDPSNPACPPNSTIVYGGLGPVTGLSTQVLVPDTVDWFLGFEGGGDQQSIGRIFDACPGGGFSITDVSRQDGQPDTCGDPPPEYIPPQPQPDLPPLPDPDPIPGPTGDVNIDVQFGPESISIEIDGDVAPSIDFDGDGDGGGGLPGRPESPDSPPGATGNDPADPAPGEQQGEQNLRGVLVISSQPAGYEGSQWFQAGAPDLYLPRLGNIWFWYPVGAESSGWVGPIEVRQRREIIFTPELVPAKAWRWVPAPGVNASVYAITVNEEE